MANFKRFFLLIAFWLFSTANYGQLLSNGSFISGVLNWGCGAEINTEMVYGGSSAVNNVVEVDAAAGLCQTISGLVTGNTYSITLDASRRTGGCPSPAVTNINLSIGTSLSAILTRTNTAFGWTSSSYVFTAASAAQVLNFSAGTGFGGSTCGMIIDNIAIGPVTILPIELMSFSGKATENTTEICWSTASEKNNKQFELERSSDGIHFENILSVPSKAIGGNSLNRLDYSASDETPLSDITYYRLKQSDFDKTFSQSKIIEIVPLQNPTTGISIYPNPNSGSFSIQLQGRDNRASQVSVYISDQLGNLVYSKTVPGGDEQSGGIEVATGSSMKAGSYLCRVISGTVVYYQKIILQ